MVIAFSDAQESKLKAESLGSICHHHSHTGYELVTHCTSSVREPMREEDPLFSTSNLHPVWPEDRPFGTKYAEVTVSAGSNLANPQARGLSPALQEAV